MKNSSNVSLYRSWFDAKLKSFGRVALGFDKSTLLLQMAKVALVALIYFSGKAFLKKQKELSSNNLKTIQGSNNNVQLLLVCAKELSFCELQPQALSHDPNGR